MKICTLNLRHNADRWDERLPLVVEHLHAQQADIIGLQEVYIPIRQAHLVADALNQRTPDQPYSVWVEPKWGRESHEGVGTLTRLPVLSHDRLDLPLAERVAQRLTLDVPGQPIHFANTHLHHRPEHDESIREPQMDALLAWMFAYQPGSWLLTGDFNALPASSTIQKAAARLRSAHPQHPQTFPSPLADGDYDSVTLDYIFYDPQRFVVEQAAVFADQPAPHDSILYPSDHYGLAADFRFAV